jgi:hypothetical protein
LSVNITVPPTDPAQGLVGEAIPFQAIAWDESSGDVTSKAWWEWDFGDGAVSPENPTGHAFAQVGTYTVTATAIYNDEKARDTVEVEVVQPGGRAGDGGAPPQRVELGFRYDNPTTVPSHWFGAEVCHFVQVVLRDPDGGQGVTFYRKGPGDQDWVFVQTVGWTLHQGDGGVSEAYVRWGTPPEHNDTIDWKAEYSVFAGLDEQGQPIWVPAEAFGTATVNNMVVHSDNGILIWNPDHPDDNQLDIHWSLGHLEDFPDAQFEATIEIRALDGTALREFNVEAPGGPGEYITPWDGQIDGPGPGQLHPAPKGIYSYLVTVHHGMPTVLFDKDKSAVLQATIDKFVYFDIDVENARLKGGVVYQLNRSASECWVTLYGPDPQTGAQLTELDSLG